ncbi:MAG: hypothetical protein ACFFER_00865 [Candidatus Thorarchaeota archaeon]
MNTESADDNLNAANQDESIAAILSGKRAIPLNDFKSILAAEFDDISSIIKDSKMKGVILVSGTSVYNPFELSLTQVKANLNAIESSLEDASATWKAKYDSLEELFHGVEEPLDLYLQTCTRKDWRKLIDEGLNILLKLHKLQDGIDKLEDEIQKQIDSNSLKIRKYSIGASELLNKDFPFPELDWIEKGVGLVMKHLEDLEIDINQAVFEFFSDDDMALQFKNLFFDETPDFSKLKLIPKLIPLLAKAKVIDQQITFSETLRQRLLEIEPEGTDASEVD